MTDLAPINHESFPSGEPSAPLQLVSDAPMETPVDENQAMDEHVTYHPVTNEMIALYSYYVLDEQGPTVAAEHCAAVGMDAEHTQRFVDLLPHFATPGDYPFDQTHGFSIALTQGFFGPYFYINAARLSRLGDLVAPFTQSWQETLPDWEIAASAQNRLLSRYSSGVFITASQVARFMTDAHDVPELAEALSAEFPDTKLHVLWTALQAAHDTGAGLLEAAGAIEPNAADLMATQCFTRYEYCDQASLQHYVASHTAQASAPPPPWAAPELPVPAHMAEKVFTNPGDRLPSTPSLTERLRAKRGDD